MRLGITLAVGLMLLGLPGTASAAPPLGPDGETAPVYDYTQAVRERVLIPQPGIDQDGNGVPDKITVDIIRPSGSGPANKIPAIIDPSPYFTTLCRGLRGECMGDMDADGVNDHWPLFLDNFFVPRGYAVILGQMNGTGYTSDGCPMHGGPGDVAGEKSIIDWLNGRVAGLAAPNWHNGKAAMIGKSYDGTLANGVAATGVDGLTTIVPQSAISDWYDYSRSNGIRTSSTHYPTFLNQAITFDATPSPGVSLPNRLSICNAAVNTGFNTIDGDDTGDRNPFWEQRNYRTNVGNVKAAVFAVHGFQDDNVKMDQLWPWWNGLKAAGVPRKLWLLRSGHTDPFDARRDVWVDTLHRWFDHWLYGVDNGIMSEPAVTIEDDKDVWGEYGDWPIPGTSDVNVFLQGTTADAAGALRGTSGGPLDSVAFTGTSNIPSETTVMNTPEGQQTSRRVFLSRPLTKDVRLSGLATIDLHASLSTAQSNLGAVVVDYNATTFPEVSRNGEGISSSGPLTSCWGTESTYDKSCYAAVTKPIQNVTQWRVTRGILDSSNRDSLTTPQPVTPGANTAFSIPLEPTEHTFAAGHQIGVVIVGNLLGTAGTPSSQITVDAKLSKLVLPVAGGDAAARASALTDETAPATTASFSPAANAAGWTRATSVTLTADDGDGSGAATLAYTLNGAAQTVSDRTVTLPLADGTTSLTYAATDRAGHTEAEKSLTLKVDGTAPALTFTHPATTTFARGEIVALNHACTDAGSGIAGCTGPAKLDTSKAGAFTAAVTATDTAGNTLTQSWAYKVLGTLPKLGLKTKPGHKLALTSPVAATVKITGAVRTLTVKLRPRVTRVVTLQPKRKQAKIVALKLVTRAGSLRRTQNVTLHLRR